MALRAKRDDACELTRSALSGGFQLSKSSDHGFKLVDGLSDEFGFFVLGEKNEAALDHPNLFGFWKRNELAERLLHCESSSRNLRPGTEERGG